MTTPAPKGERLTVEQVEEWREMLIDPAPWASDKQRAQAVNALCDLALQSAAPAGWVSVPRDALFGCLKFVDFCRMQALTPHPDGSINLPDYHEDLAHANELSEQLRFMLAAAPAKHDDEGRGEG